ncbi:MAG: QueT transporter family protein [Firmicutes bacterium]|nr:QueT transporter family protein [Bacillota bacterium]
MRFRGLKGGPSARRIAMAAAVAAVYAGLTIGLSPISYGAVQFRAAEILNLMAFFDPFCGLGVVLGCFLANLLGPDSLGLMDVVFGTAATALAVWAIAKIGRAGGSLLLASFMPVFANAVVSAELTLVFRTPLWFNLLTVAAGEFAAVVCVGYPLFALLRKNNLLRFIR